MSDIVTFLLARIAEDERIARRAEESPGSYRGHPSGTAPLWTVSAASARGREIGPRGSVEATPGRVLADCVAKRAIVELHRHEDKGSGPTLYDGSRNSNEGVFGCVICSCVNDDPGWHFTDGWCATLRALVAPFADHPDFDPAWTVTA